ncbi:hypothetical protein [Rummeliibacillus sp. SL167]|uniref:hypothetical protein n=1 Tax=Rummeliibacillus sp. SL167 TaxID=2579792 RepID=UPI002105A321|nr:hypothetical protein [Rummeliibacillus sp. SL167]
MEHIWNRIILIISTVLISIVSIVSPVFPFAGDKSLNSKKIDANIKKLSQIDWFKEIYESEKYRHLFFENRNVRKYLSNNLRVNQLIRQQNQQEKFIQFLNKQLKIK